MAWASSDTFVGRTVADNTTGNWGTASDGETWSCLQGGASPTHFAVASSEGTINTAGVGQIAIMKLGSNSGTDMEVSCRISPGTSNDAFYVFVRLTDSTHYYRLDVNSTIIQIGTKNGGGFVSLATASVGYTATVGTFYRFRFRAIGSNLYGKSWQDGNAEPQTWQVAATDANVASGGIGCGVNPQSSTNAQFDTFNAFTIDAALTDPASLSDSASWVDAPTQTDSNSLAEATTVKSATTTTDSNSLTDTSGNTDTYNGADNLDGYRATILNDRPSTYYRFGESSGTVSTDETNNANATYNNSGVTYAQPGAIAGDTNTSVLLDGITGRIDCPSRLAIANLSSISVECWIKLSNASFITFPRVVADFYEGGANKNGFQLLLAPGGAGGNFYIGNGTTANQIGFGAITFNTTLWYHLVGTWDGSNIRTYVNGILKGTTAQTGPIGVPPNNVGIGYNPNYNGDYVPGQIDEVAIYDYALSQAQITAHYNAGTAFQNETLSQVEAPTLTDSNSLADTSSNTPATTLTDSGASLADSFSETVTEIGGIVLWQDTFSGRTVADNTTGNLGTASDGEAWSCLQAGASPTHFAVTSGEGTINTSGVGQIVIMRIGVTSGADAEALCRLSPGTSADTIDVFVRLTDSVHYYRLDLTGTTLRIGTKNGGGFVSLATAPAGLTLTPGTFYWLRFRAVGTSLSGKVWQDGNIEPAWMVTASDSSVASGGVGLGCNPQSSTNVQFDSFSAATVTPALQSFADTSAYAEALSLTDQNQLTDKLKVVDVNGQLLLVAITVCRSGLVTTTSRGN